MQQEAHSWRLLQTAQFVAPLPVSPLKDMDTKLPKEIMQELDDILLDFCDDKCVETHRAGDHKILKNVVRTRLITLLERLTMKVDTTSTIQTQTFTH